jgi:hypothetical protein
MKILKLTFFLLLAFQISFGQTKDSIPKNFVKIEGLEYNGEISFYFEKKNQTILAYQNEKVMWKTNVMKICGKPSVGKPKIRLIEIGNKFLKIVYGKHSFAEIEVETGKVTCGGSD